MSEKTEQATSRRDFLKLAGTAAPVLAAVAAVGATPAEASIVDAGAGRMQDTAHTRAYLESTRF
ncbi:MAG: hypothetical protein ACI9IV_001254 [Paracoccaceae bacterium]|jgi:hypothetical protein|tara:strand:+ start:455 stop:646 length:192 start_codon:yes stop_codon:yes gene_type:complete